MFRILTLLFFFFSVLFGAVVPRAESQTVKIVFNSGTPPLKFVDASGKPAGMLLDIWRLWSQKTGVQVAFIEAPWDDTLSMVKNGQADIHGGLYYTKERNAYLDYTSRPMYQNKNYFFYQKDLLNIDDENAMEPYVVGVGNGYPRTFMEENYPKILTKEYKDNDSTVEALLKGEVKVVLNSLPLFVYTLKQRGINPGEFVYVEEHPAFVKDYFGAVKKGNKKLLALVDSGFAKITPEEIKQIEEKWTKNLDTSALTAGDKNIHLSIEELNWIAKNRSVKVGGETDWAPFDFAKDGKYRGIAHDILELVGQRTGLHFKYEFGTDWDTIIKDFKAGKYDLLPAIYKSGEREKYALFSPPYFTVTDYAFVRKGDDSLKSIKDLEHKKVAVIKGYAIVEKLKEHFPKMKLVLVNSLKSGIDAVLLKKADVYIDGYTVVMYGMANMMLAGIKPALPIDLYSNALHFATSIDKPLLASVVQKGLDSIDEEEMSAIFRKWYGLSQKAIHSSAIGLSNKELAWLKAHPKLRFTGDPDWLPFEAFDEKGNYVGIVAEHLALIEHMLPVSFEKIKTKNWDESIKKAKTKEVDILSETINSPLSSHLLFTKAYLKNPIVIVMKEGSRHIGSLKQLEGKNVAVVKDYGYVKKIKDRYPNIHYIDVKNIQEGFLSVAAGKADAFLETLALSAYNIENMGINNLKIVGKTEFTMDLGLGVRKDYAPLVGILNKAIDAIDDADHQMILDHWSRYDLGDVIDYSLVWKIVAAALALIAFIVFWNLKMAKEIKRRKAAEIELSDREKFIRTLFDLQKQIIITTDGKKIRSANKAFLEFFSLVKLEDFLLVYSCICDLFENVEGKTYLQKEMDGLEWVAYISAHPDKTHKACIGGTIFTVYAASFSSKGERFSMVVLNDITSLEKAQEEVEKSKKQQELALEGGKMGSWHIDFMNEEMVVNERWASMLGYTLEEITPSLRSSWVGTIYEADREKVLAFGRQYRDGEAENYDIEYRAVTKTGEIRWLVSRGAAVKRDAVGRVVQMAGTVMDITEQKCNEEKIKEFNKKLSDSINYASLIQRALLPDSDEMLNAFGTLFVLWEPKDVVGGDIYFFEKINEDETVMMVIDCTGHGVPGAFMTMLVKALEKSIIGSVAKNGQDIHPAEMLQLFNRNIKTLLGQYDGMSASNSGFDGGIVYVDKKRGLLRFSGGQTPLFYFDKSGELHIIKSDKKGIGYKSTDMNYVYLEHELKLQDVESLFVTTDGYLDQNGGTRSFPLGKKRFGEILKASRGEDFYRIKKRLQEQLEEWQGDEERNDDIAVIGIRF